MSARERRVVSVKPLEVREADGELKTVSGYAAVFNTETVIAGLFREQIQAGAFADAIGRDDVRALFNHDPNFVLGRTSAKTLRLSEDETGLHYTVDPPPTQWATDLVISIARGDVSQSSFAFSVDAEEWVRAQKPGELPLRVIKRATLYDVSPVTYPAYEETSVSARSAAEENKADDVEALAHARACDRARFDLAVAEATR